jgi:hypothetical protein
MGAPGLIPSLGNSWHRRCKEYDSKGWSKNRMLRMLADEFCFFN